MTRTDPTPLAHWLNASVKGEGVVRVVNGSGGCGELAPFGGSAAHLRTSAEARTGPLGRETAPGRYMYER